MTQEDTFHDRLQLMREEYNELFKTISESIAKSMYSQRLKNNNIMTTGVDADMYKIRVKYIDHSEDPWREVETYLPVLSVDGARLSMSCTWILRHYALVKDIYSDRMGSNREKKVRLDEDRGEDWFVEGADWSSKMRITHSPTRAEEVLSTIIDTPWTAPDCEFLSAMAVEEGATEKEDICSYTMPYKGKLPSTTIHGKEFVVPPYNRDKKCIVSIEEESIPLVGHHKTKTVYVDDNGNYTFEITDTPIGQTING